MTRQTYRVYTSAMERLASLPEVFTGRDLTVLYGWTSGICSSYLAQWRKAGLIESLGGRSDVHMNRVGNRLLNSELALRRAYPQAIKLGVDVLRAALWTTQIPSSIEVAVSTGSAAYSLKGFVISTRTAKWMERARPGVQRVEDGLDRLRPAWALADMLARAHDARVRQVWLLDPDDVDWQAVRADKQIEPALTAMGLAMSCLEDAALDALFTIVLRRSMA
jgi:hypothetical protein